VDGAKRLAPLLMGLYALHSLAEFAIAYRLITKDDLD